MQIGLQTIQNPMEQIHYYYWYSALVGIPYHKRAQLLSCYGSLSNLFSEKDIPWECFPDFHEEEIRAFSKSRNEDAIIRDFEMLKNASITFIPLYDSAYSSLLKQIYDPPFGLFCIGNTALLNRWCVAVIGSRRCSPYGINCAESIAEYLSGQGVVVVSGMARGIDSCAHRGALQTADNSSIAVLAGGVDICYPRQNIELYHNLAGRGLIISEMPPHTPPLPYYFPIRNRIISGLCHSIVVVEAELKSGTKITADCALEQGRDVYAVPGRIYDSSSFGCNQLLQQGATPLLHPEEILKNASFSPDFSVNRKDFSKKTLEKDEILLYSCVDCEPVHMDELARRTGLNRGTLALLLEKLEWKGYIEQPLKNYYMKRIDFNKETF